MSDYITENEAKAAVDENKTGNISKQKREDLLNKIEEIRKYISTAPQDENTGNLLSYLSEIEKDVNGKKYGLVFEEHREDIDEVLDTHTPVLTEETDLFIDNGGQMNFLIEGDNLASLKLLEKTHKGKIDLIYIDPPYNTGSKDFIYDDVYIDNNDTFSHSKWISFTKNRLKTAHKLLSKNGIIFISISDIELYNIKLLCDELFGGKNFIANLIWTNKEGGGSSDSKLFRVKHEYILVYAKNIDFAEIKGVKVNNEDRYKFSDEYEEIRGKFYLQKLGMGSIQYSTSLDYPIEAPDGSLIMPADNNSGKKACWRWSKPKFKWGCDNGFVVIKKDSKGIWTVYTKQYLNCDNEGNIIERTQRPLGVIDTYSSTQGAKQLRQVFPDSPFSYPKDTNLICWINERIPRNNITILDFFAGSGTTGHAVMKLNAEDGGNRKFILCTNNENNICRDVTYERIKRVIDKEDYSASLKYFKVDYVPITERMYYEYADELLKHIRELVELENGINFIGNTEIAIVLTDEELSEFTSNIEQYSACKKLYMGHDLLPDEEQERIIRENDIEISIIPDYYYKDLQER